jgi:hypothetical protein
MKSDIYIRIKIVYGYVYGFVSLESILSTMTNNVLVLVNPTKWDDPFENAFLKRKFLLPNGSYANFDRFNSSWYGQCWTKCRNSDSMWRIYSSEGKGVRIRSTVAKLSDALWLSNNQLSPVKFFTGSVKYQRRKQLEHLLETIPFESMIRGESNITIAESLLLKRSSFSHEKEVRLLAHILPNDGDDRRRNNGLYFIPINPSDLVDDICFDPRATDRYFDLCKNIIKLLGYTGKISRSSLYSFDPPVITN